MSGHCKDCRLPGDFPCVRAGHEDRDGANVVESGSTGGYGWAGQGCGELETGPAAVSPCSVMSHGFLSHEQDAEDWDSKV